MAYGVEMKKGKTLNDNINDYVYNKQVFIWTF